MQMIVVGIPDVFFLIIIIIIRATVVIIILPGEGFFWYPFHWFSSPTTACSMRQAALLYLQLVTLSFIWRENTDLYVIQGVLKFSPTMESPVSNQQYLTHVLWMHWYVDGHQATRIWKMSLDETDCEEFTTHTMIC